MSRFLLGLAVGVLGTYAALKFVDKETRDEFCDEVGKAAGKAKDKIEKGLKTGRGKAMRAGVVVRREVREGKKKINEATGNIAGKLAENLTEIEARAKANATAK